jgi:acetylornithine deacetylase/succinyl-diaminopimelate desuccinylase-like protein
MMNEQNEGLKGILEKLPWIAEKLRDRRELILANAVLMGEIPAPTFQEQNRIRYVMDRFAEAGLERVSTDEMDNATAILPGSKGERNFLVVAHADTVHGAELNHRMEVLPDRVTGLGIADNSLGLAAVMSLPLLLEYLGIRLESNLILQASSRTLGKGNLQGLTFFLDHCTEEIDGAICVEGVHLGRLSYSSLGMLRGEIQIKVVAAGGWDEYGGRGGIVVLHELLSKILSIPVAAVPKTSIILGSVSAGSSYNIPPTRARLRFEVRSEASGQVSAILAKIEEIVAEIRAERNVDVQLQVFSRRKIGGIAFGHPLVSSCRAIMEHLDIEPKIAPSVGMLSATADRKIPALTLGLTEGESLQMEEECILVEPVFKGLAQLIGVLLAMDQGVADA